MKNNIIIENWGLIDYQTAWDTQKNLQKSLIDQKRARRGQEEVPKVMDHYLVLCQHPHVYTLGKSGSQNHLLVNRHFMEKEKVQYYEINRGGDITYHGPGQLVAYPILDMEYIFTDIHRYIRTLEEVIIQVLADFGIVGYRMPDYTGVWVGQQNQRKICAIGVHLSRWVSMHGLAFNIDTDLKYFNYIIPCGIQEDNKSVTSLSRELQRPLSVEEVQPLFVKHFLTLFELNPIYAKSQKS